MLSLVYKSGFFRNIKTKANVTIAGPTDPILREKCAPFQFLTNSLLTNANAGLHVPPVQQHSDTNLITMEDDDAQKAQKLVKLLSDPIYRLNSDNNDNENKKSSETDNKRQKNDKLSKEELKQILRHVKSILSEQDISALAQLVRTVNRGEDTLGLCAPQIHIAKRLFIGCHEMTFSADRSSVESHSLEAYFNPEVIDKSDKLCREAEGCLSFPGTFVIKSRPEQIRVRYTNLLGETVTQDLAGFPARIFQHELDHLDGVVMHDYVKMDPGDAIPFTIHNMYDYVDENGNVLDKYKWCDVSLTECQETWWRCCWKSEWKSMNSKEKMDWKCKFHLSRSLVLASSDWHGWLGSLRSPEKIRAGASPSSPAYCKFSPTNTTQRTAVA